MYWQSEVVFVSVMAPIATVVVYVIYLVVCTLCAHISVIYFVVVVSQCI